MTECDVVHVLPRFSRSHWGGAETSVVNLTPHLADRGFRSVVWTNRLPGEASSETIAGVPVIRFESRFLSKRERGMSGRGKSALSPGLLWRLIRGRRPAVLHLHTHNRTASLLTVIARARRVPTVLTLHSRFVLIKPRWIFWFPNEAAVRLADAVVAVSSAIQKMVQEAGIRRDRSWVIANGVDTARFIGASGDGLRGSLDLGDAPVVLCVGRIYAVKNQLHLIDAFEAVLEKVPEAHLVLVGFSADDDYFDSVTRAVSSSSSSAQFHLLTDVTPDDDLLYESYAAADVVAVPSKFESQSLVVLEAWSAGAPVVANAVGGIPEMIVDGSNGVLVEPSEDPHAFAQALIEVLTEVSLRDSLKEGARKSVSRYSWESAADALVDVYRAVSR